MIVPVLSEQITVAHPNVSTDGNFLTSALFFTILDTPIANAIVTTAGNPSGTAATANVIPDINISITGSPLSIPVSATTKHIPTHINTINFPKLSSLFCNGVKSSSTFCIIFAILPILVSIPTLSTTTLPQPFLTSVPIYTLHTSLFLSFLATIFCTAHDSPLNKDSSTFKSVSSIIYPSAGTLSPASNNITSPTTTSCASITITLPSRITVPCGDASLPNFSIVRSVLNSCINPNIAFTTTILIIVTPSSISPMNNDIAVLANNINTIKSPN